MRAPHTTACAGMRQKSFSAARLIRPERRRAAHRTPPPDRALRLEEAEPGREGRPGEDVLRLSDHPPKEARDAETRTRSTNLPHPSLRPGPGGRARRGAALQILGRGRSQARTGRGQVRAQEEARLRATSSGACPKCGKNPPAPERSLCATCLERGRAAELARYIKRKLEGATYGGRCPESRRRMARERNRRRRRERCEAGLCALCGRQEPGEGSAVCETCREERNNTSYYTSLYRERERSGIGCRCGNHRPGCLVGGGSGISSRL